MKIWKMLFLFTHKLHHPETIVNFSYFFLPGENLIAYVNTNKYKGWGINLILDANPFLKT